jgi:hypothetical protein
MQNVEWLTFGLSNAISRTIIHFFPSAQVTSAPYPVIFKLRVFGKDIVSKSIALEGGRLGQPDGVRLEDAFPHLADGTSGIIGLHVELSTSQPRIDLSTSHIVIELVSSAQSVRFSPRQMKAHDRKLTLSNENKLPCYAIAGINDAFFVSSLAVINYADKPFVPKLISPRPSTLATVSEPPDITEIGFDAVAAGNAQEFSLHEGMFTDVVPQEMTWGLIRSRVFEVSGDVPSDVGCYLVYRDSLTKRIVSATQV